MEFIDTHTHPHMPGYKKDIPDFFLEAKAAHVNTVICVGTDVADSRRAVDFAAQHTGAYASIGLHPHEATHGVGAVDELKLLFTQPQVVAIGECGLDYYYENSPKTDQKQVLRAQLTLAQELGLPVIFHVRDAFADFFEIYDDFKDISGVVHSFSTNRDVLNACLERGLYIGLNGIMTFTRDEDQLQAAREVPLEYLLLETDAPFLTPTPYRGTVNHSAHIKTVADFLAKLRGESVEEIAQATTHNARALFTFS